MTIKHISLLSVCLCYLGTVDYVANDFARVELRASEEVYSADMPVIMFPCEIAEGDFFYIEIIDGVSEIRCGEPDT